MAMWMNGNVGAFNPVPGMWGNNAFKQIRQNLLSLENQRRLTFNARQLLEKRIPSELLKIENLINGLNWTLRQKSIEHMEPRTRDLVKELGLGFIISRTKGWQVAAPKDIEELSKIKAKMSDRPKIISVKIYPVEVPSPDGIKRIEQDYEIIYMDCFSEKKGITGRILGSLEDMSQKILEGQNQAYDYYQDLEGIK